MNKIKLWNRKKKTEDTTAAPDVLERFQEFLKRRVDPDNGLLDKLYKRRAISHEQMEDISSENTYEARNDKLFGFILARNSYKKFTKALRATDQSHVAIFLRANGDYKNEFGDEWPLSDGHLSLLDANERSFADTLVIDRRLMDLLFSKGVINQRKKKALSSKATSEERNCLFLHILRRCSFRLYKATLLCLRETNQSTIARTLDEDLLETITRPRNIGEFSRHHSEERDKRWHDVICRHYDFIADRMSPDFGLIDKLYATGTFTNLERNIIDEQNIVQYKNQKILRYILNKSDPGRLIDALRESGQRHLVRYLENDGNYSPALGADWPLTDKEMFTLDSNYEILNDLLEMSDLHGHLYATGVINRRERDFISSKRLPYKQNKAFLEMLRRCSLNSYLQTIRCLRASKQEHIAKILENEGVVAKVDSSLEETTGLDINEAEQEIVGQISRLLGDRSLPEYSDIWRQVLELRLIGAKQGNSVSLYFFCQKSSHINHLEEVTEDGRLKTIIEILFNQFLKHHSVQIHVRLKWIEECFNQCTETLKDIRAKEGQQIPKLRSMMDLPLEVLDIILEKAYFFKVTQRGMQNCGKSDLEIISHLSLVELFWSQRISRKRFKKSIWSRLSKFLKGWNSLKLYLQYIEENNRLCSALISSKTVDCLSDMEAALLRRKIQSVQKGSRQPHRAEEISSALLNFGASELDNFLEYLRRKGEKSSAKVFERGGATVRVEIRGAKNPNRKQSIRQFANLLCDLETSGQSRSDEAEHYFKEMVDRGIEILNATEDREAVVWLWCKSTQALETLKSMDQSQCLTGMLRRFVPKKAHQLVQQTYINMNYDRLANEVVFVPTIKLNLFERITFSENLLGGSRLSGMTKYCDRIYIVCRYDQYMSSLIYVFESRRPFRFINKVLLADKVFATDIAACEQETCLYLIDSFLNDYRCIWKIKEAQQSKWLQFRCDFRPETLHVTNKGQLMMVSKYPSATLRVYGSQTQQHLVIQLPLDIVEPRHALMTSNGTFVILHARWSRETVSNQTETSDENIELSEIVTWVVSEISRNGKTINRRYFVDDKLDLSTGGHLAIDSDDRLLIADTGNDRVILLDSDLRWNRVLIPLEGEKEELSDAGVLKPFRLLLDEENRQLIVGGMLIDSGVNVYATILA